MRTLTALSLAAAVGLAGFTGAQATAPAAVDATQQTVVGPKLQYIPEEIDFGEIDDSKVVEKVVTLVNIGDELLQISRDEGLRASCGCTVPALPKYKIEPGESVEMTVRFDPRNREGNQHKTISITPVGSSAPSVLPVKSFVVQRVKVVEGIAQFGHVNQGEDASIEIHVRGIDADFRVTEVIPSRDDIFATEIVGTEIVQRAHPVTGDMTDVGETKIRVTLKGSAPIGRTDGKLTIRTNDAVSTEREIRAIASVTGDVRLDPAVVRLGALEPGSSFEHTINVYSHKEQSFNVERVLFVTSDLSEADKALIQTSHEPITDDSGRVGHAITFKGDVSDTMKIIRGKLVIVTDAPGQRVVSANVAGVVRANR